MAGLSVISSLMLMVCVLLPLSCLAEGSCKGRCGEPFSRGQLCDCDHSCLAHNECCKDYEDVCTTRRSCSGRCGETFRRGRECECDPDCTLYNTCCIDYLGQCYSDPSSTAARSAQVNHKSTDNVEDLTNPTGSPVPPDAWGPLSPGPAEPTAGRPSTLADIAEALGATDTAGLTDSSDPELCNDLPINGVTAMFNGSVIVFRGHFFWLIDPQTREAGHARSITAELGVPSPIDTALTRCNCQAKTYIIKNGKYWSFENGVLEAGYPRSLSDDFGGLSGDISAALSMPSTRKRPEVIYFFKKGGTVQKFSYPPGSSPKCSRKKPMNSIYNRGHQASPEGAPTAVHLSGEINIKLSWKGVPSPVTSAVSMPNPRKPDGFEYFIASWPKFFSIKISGEKPTLAAPAKPSGQQNDVMSWLGCP